MDDFEVQEKVIAQNSQGSEKTGGRGNTGKVRALKRARQEQQ